METFMLWGAAVEPGTLSLSFYATRIQEQCISQGTRQMIDTMLSDMGCDGVEHTEWTTRHFLNNYYASSDQPISSHDAWSDTWEISLTLAHPASTDLIVPNDDRAICRTFTRDETWDGTPPPSQAAYVIVARFYNQPLFARALAALSEIREPQGRKDPELQDLIDALKEHSSASDISVRQHAGAPLTLAITLGTFNEESFSTRGAPLAELVSELMHEFGATITWDEKADYLMQQQRYTR